MVRDGECKVWKRCVKDIHAFKATIQSVVREGEVQVWKRVVEGSEASASLTLTPLRPQSEGVRKGQA